MAIDAAMWLEDEALRLIKNSSNLINTFWFEFNKRYYNLLLD